MEPSEPCPDSDQHLSIACFLMRRQTWQNWQPSSAHGPTLRRPSMSIFDGSRWLPPQRRWVGFIRVSWMALIRRLESQTSGARKLKYRSLLPPNFTNRIEKQQQEVVKEKAMIDLTAALGASIVASFRPGLSGDQSQRRQSMGR